MSSNEHAMSPEMTFGMCLETRQLNGQRRRLPAAGRLLRFADPPPTDAEPSGKVRTAYILCQPGIPYYLCVTHLMQRVSFDEEVEGLTSFINPL